MHCWSLEDQHSATTNQVCLGRHSPPIFRPSLKHGHQFLTECTARAPPLQAATGSAACRRQRHQPPKFATQSTAIVPARPSAGPPQQRLLLLLLLLGTPAAGRPCRRRGSSHLAWKEAQGTRATCEAVTGGHRLTFGLGHRPGPSSARRSPCQCTTRGPPTPPPPPHPTGR